jgi:hypothetical protein
MPLVQTRGAASAQGFGEFAQAAPVIPYIEDVFSTYLYTGTGASQTITNNINTTTYGGLTWIKGRSDATGHRLTDTTRGVTKSLESNSTAAETTDTTGLTAFGTTGFTIGADADYNTSAATYVSWTFREQAKFFDIVTYTGDGISNRAVNHNLGSVPACILLKRTDSATSWFVYHRSTGGTPQDNYLQLNTTDSLTTSVGAWGTTAFTDTQFRVSSFGGFNASGGTYVAYIYAHNAGGFGLTGTDNVISCGSYTGTSTVGNEINVGFEPQFIIIKRATGTAENWVMFDNMRGISTGGNDAILYPSGAFAEYNAGNYIGLTATGFKIEGSSLNVSGDTYIYIAIRRGPMKVPTVGTSVFSPNARTGNGADQTVSGLSFSPDLWMTKNRGSTQLNWLFDRLRGPDQPLSSNLTASEATNTSNYFGGTPIFTPTNTGFKTIDQGQTNSNVNSYIDWLFGRAPSFFDEVCYTGDGTSNPARSISHSLGVKPEFAILKSRSASGNWLSVVNIGSSYVYSSAGSDFGLNLTSFPAANLFIGTTYVSATAFQLGFLVPDIDVSATQRDKVNANSATYVAYLFATCPGVSKVGKYTGNGTTQTIDCGFTGGARFVLIKRTDATGDWYVYDTARGMTVLTDPYLLLNTTAAEVATLGSVTTVSTGFALNSTILAAINVSAATYIFLAIA